MKLNQFRVTNYRSVHDSGWVMVNDVTAFVGQNEAGKSNLFEALYRINPFVKSDQYDIREDWPVDNWGNKRKDATVCDADFAITDAREIAKLLAAVTPPAPAATESTSDAAPAQAPNPAELTLRASRKYEGPTTFAIVNSGLKVDAAKLAAWAEASVPKLVYIGDYGLSGAQTDLEQLAQRKAQHKWHELGSDDQTILIILDLAELDIDDVVAKGKSQDGRTERAFDTKSASGWLSNRFKALWTQKKVDFDIAVDGPTLNIFARDVGADMPVRLQRRSTGFRWHVSFAWRFTYATKGEYKNCILLLEEPGIHLHFDGQRDLLNVFERLSASNTILYTTHLASMVDLANPERVRIVETRDRRTTVVEGIVSSQRGPMAVIEASLALTGQMSGLLGNRRNLIVEGGDDALILHKLSGVMRNGKAPYLSDDIYVWPAKGAANTPMYAGFAVSQKWDAAVLLDSDAEGQKASKKINELFLKKLAAEDQKRFRVLMIDKAAGITQTDVAIEDIFPVEFYLECVNQAYGINVTPADLPVDGSMMITKRVEAVLKSKHARSELDKELVMGAMLAKFDQWKSTEDLPTGTAERAGKLFNAINQAFGV